MEKANVMMRDKHVTNTLDLLSAVFADYPGRDFAIRLWDGTLWEPPGSSMHRFTIALNGPSALRRMFFPPTERKLGEAYMFGDFEIEGELYAAIDLARYLWEGWSLSDTLRFAPKLLRLPSRDPGSNNQIAHLRARNIQSTAICRRSSTTTMFPTSSISFGSTRRWFILALILKTRTKA